MFYVQAEYSIDTSMFQDDSSRFYWAKFVCDLFEMERYALLYHKNLAGLFGTPK